MFQPGKINNKIVPHKRDRHHVIIKINVSSNHGYGDVGSECVRMKGRRIIFFIWYKETLKFLSQKNG